VSAIFRMFCRFLTAPLSSVCKVETEILSNFGNAALIAVSLLFLSLIASLGWLQFAQCPGCQQLAGAKGPHVHVQQLLATAAGDRALKGLHEVDLLKIIHFVPLAFLH